ncbi:glutathione S-transferase T3-like [Capsella rubella]|uniref:glutathione S-transferase T3-like n=1 Tax=Capsella rubella TaxID=81985 RepID=UPI000CD4EE4B|nr:glutathione S-transferase T3-like [Capsella rubella]
MDSNNPYGGSPGYFSLNNFPYDNFSQNVNFGPTAPTQFATNHLKEAKTLLVAKTLLKPPQMLIGREERRLPDHCKQIWGRIRKEVSHFCGAYGTAEAEKASGMNDVDVLKNAHTIYMSLYKKKFGLEHAWVELRQEQKWCSLGVMNPTSNTSSKRRRGEDAPASCGSIANETESMLEGVKAMKGKRFRGKDKAPPAKDYPQLWENKEKDTETKLKLQKLAILDTLIAKTQPLDEDELALKKKLMAELF